MARKTKVPSQTFTNAILDGATREFPSLECLSNTEREELFRRVPNLIDFESQARTPVQVIDYLVNRLSSRPGFEGKIGVEDFTKPTKRKYFFRDTWDGGSMMIVKEGKRPITDGFHMLLAHSDTPCLRIKPRPIRLEWNPEQAYNFLGVRLSAAAHGGISVHQWLGQQVRILGYRNGHNGKREPIDVPAVVGDFSAHTDYRKEDETQFPLDKSLEVITGHSNVRETLQTFGLESIDDFAELRLYAVPTGNPLLIDQDSWRLLVGYGHDDRAGTFSAVDAIIKARDPEYTSIVWVTDREESGDDAPSGAAGSLFDLVLDHLFEKERKKRHRSHISERERRLALSKSYVLVTDMDVAPYGPDADNMDAESAPKIGLGTAIATETEFTSSSSFVSDLRSLARARSARDQNICHQMCGFFYSQDREDLWSHQGSGKDMLFNRIGNWGWVSIPCASMHSHNEVICPADELWTSRFYRRFLEYKH